MNVKEKLVIGDFIDGSAIVYKKQDMRLVRGLMFEDGTTMFFDVLHLGDFYNGRALVDTGKNVGFINRKGQFVIPAKYFLANDFSEGRTFVMNDQSTQLINTSGEEIRDFERPFVTGDFSEGYAQIGVITGDGESISLGYVDKTGELVTFFEKPRQITIPDKIIDDNDDHSCGLIRFFKNNKFGYHTIFGETVIPARYEFAEKFRDGLALVHTKDGAGFIDTRGEITIPFEFDFANGFSEGFASVEFKGKMGCINKDCDPVIPFEFDYLGSFQNGLIDFCIDNKWGLMDKYSNIIVPERYNGVGHFIDGICSVTLNNHNGVRDKNGNELFSDFIAGGEYHLLN